MFHNFWNHNFINWINKWKPRHIFPSSFALPKHLVSSAPDAAAVPCSPHRASPTSPSTAAVDVAAQSPAAQAHVTERRRPCERFDSWGIRGSEKHPAPRTATSVQRLRPNSPPARPASRPRPFQTSVRTPSPAVPFALDSLARDVSQGPQPHTPARCAAQSRHRRWGPCSQPRIAFLGSQPVEVIYLKVEQ